MKAIASLVLIIIWIIIHLHICIFHSGFFFFYQFFYDLLKASTRQNKWLVSSVPMWSSVCSHWPRHTYVRVVMSLNPAHCTLTHGCLFATHSFHMVTRLIPWWKESSSSVKEGLAGGGWWDTMQIVRLANVREHWLVGTIEVVCT